MKPPVITILFPQGNKLINAILRLVFHLAIFYGGIMAASLVVTHWSGFTAAVSVFLILGACFRLWTITEEWRHIHRFSLNDLEDPELMSIATRLETIAKKHLH